MPGPQFPLPNTTLGALTMAQRKQRPLYTNPVMPGAWGQFGGASPQANQMGGGFDNYLGMPASPFAFPGMQNAGVQGVGWAGGMLPPNVFNPMLLASITPTAQRSFAPSTPAPVPPAAPANRPTTGAPLNVYGGPSAAPIAPAPMSPAPMSPAAITPSMPDQLNVPARTATPYTPATNPAYNTPLVGGPMDNPYGGQLNVPARTATPYTPATNPADYATTNPVGNPYGAPSGVSLQTRPAPAATGIPGYKFGGFAVMPRGRK